MKACGKRKVNNDTAREALIHMGERVTAENVHKIKMTMLNWLKSKYQEYPGIPLNY